LHIYSPVCEKQLLVLVDGINYVEIRGNSLRADYNVYIGEVLWMFL